MEREKTQNSQDNSEGEEQTWRTNTTQLTTYYKVVVIKVVWY